MRLIFTACEYLEILRAGAEPKLKPKGEVEADCLSEIEIDVTVPNRCDIEKSTTLDTETTGEFTDR